MADLDGITMGDQPVERFLIERRDRENRLDRLVGIAVQRKALRGVKGKLRHEDHKERHGRTKRLRRSEINLNYWREVLAMAKRNGAPTGQKLLACMLNGETWTYDDFAAVWKEEDKTLGSGLFSQTIRHLIEKLDPLVVKDTSVQPYQYSLRREALEMDLADLEAVRKGKPISLLEEKYPELTRGLKLDDHVQGNGTGPKATQNAQDEPLAPPERDVLEMGEVRIPQKIDVNVNVTIRFKLDFS